MTQEQPKECEACAKEASITLHGPNCIASYSSDGSCMCPVKEQPLALMNYHGRRLWLCEECYAKEQAILSKGDASLHEYQKNIPDRIEHKVAAEMKPFTTVARWQDLYTTERPQWVLSNFESIDDMRLKLTDFIISMDKLEWEIKVKKRAAYDAAKELDTRLSKEEREKLINDPNFKVPTNSEFKKIAKERELDEAIKTIGITDVTAKQRKSIQSLIDFGLSPQEIKEQMKL